MDRDNKKGGAEAVQLTLEEPRVDPRLSTRTKLLCEAFGWDMEDHVKLSIYWSGLMVINRDVLNFYLSAGNRESAMKINWEDLLVGREDGVVAGERIPIPKGDGALSTVINISSFYGISVEEAINACIRMGNKVKLAKELGFNFVWAPR